MSSPRSGSDRPPLRFETIAFVFCVFQFSVFTLIPPPRATAAESSNLTAKQVSSQPVASQAIAKQPIAKQPIAKQAAASADPAGRVQSSQRRLARSQLDKRVQRLISDLRARPAALASPKAVEVKGERGDWLKAVYRERIVEADRSTAILADKLIIASMMQRVLGGAAFRYIPKTMGLRDFLQKHSLLLADGAVVGDGDRIEQALHDEFPMGFVVRPAVGVAANETVRGLYRDSDLFIVDLLLGEQSPVYRRSHAKHPVRNDLLQRVASGESVVLQEDITSAARLVRPLKESRFREVRIHTYGAKVVADSEARRWIQSERLSPEDIERAKGLTQELLATVDRLAPGLLTRLAFGVDVAVFDNGEARILDWVTNRGQEIPWSGYLDQPRVLGAYTRHFEAEAGLRITGLGGALLRSNLGNYLGYWQMRRDRASEAGWGAWLLALLPPRP